MLLSLFMSRMMVSLGTKAQLPRLCSSVPRSATSQAAAQQEREQEWDEFYGRAAHLGSAPKQINYGFLHLHTDLYKGPVQDFVLENVPFLFVLLLLGRMQGMKESCAFFYIQHLWVWFKNLLVFLRLIAVSLLQPVKRQLGHLHCTKYSYSLMISNI